MPANGQAAASTQLNNIFGNGLNQKLNAYNTPAASPAPATSTSQATASAAVGARTPAVATATASADTNNAPANASAAPSVTASFTGLCEALNAHQRELVASGKYEIADEYAIEFAPVAIGASTVKKPGNSDFNQTPNQDVPNSGIVNPATNSVNTSAVVAPVVAGTQITQFIDKIMRNSSYMSDQQTYITDQVTGKSSPTSNSSTGQTAWYKISVKTIQLGYDKKRNDHAYKMTYVISPYAINQMQSEYFPQSRYRGVHKQYNYWFTGQNTEILDFQQEYNNLYRLVVSGLNVPILNQQTSDARNITRRTFMAASGQSDQGAKNGANEPVANAADYLYSPSDQAKIKLKITGDPAWMQQGEITTGISSSTFNFSPFNPDGGINYDSQEVVFSVSWNRPTDYNFETGLMNVNANNVTATSTAGGAAISTPQESYNYTAIKVKNTFSKGRFEQEIEGRLLVEYYSNLSNGTGTAAPQNASAAGTSATLPTTDSTSRQALTAPDGAGADSQTSPTSPTPIANNNVQPVAGSQPLPSLTPAAPTSDGVVVTAPITAPHAPPKPAVVLANGETVPVFTANQVNQNLSAGSSALQTSQIVNRET